MSYGASATLQAAIHQALCGAAEVTAQVGAAIYDALPAGPLPTLFVGHGIEDVFARGDIGGAVTQHRLTVSVYADAAGFQSAKLAAVAVSDVLDGAALALDRGRLLSLRFERAQARRTHQNRKRRIDLRFVALVDSE